MIKKILALVICVILISGVCVQASADINLEFNREDFSLSVDAGSLGAINSVTTITIVENDDAISGENLPVYAYVYKTDSQGNLNEKILLPTSTQSGRLCVYVDSNAFSEKGTIVILNENDETTLSLIDEILLCADKESLSLIVSDVEKSEALGLDLSDVQSPVITDASYVCFGEIQGIEALTPFDFKNTFNKCMVYAEIKNGGDVDEAMRLYASSFGTTWEEYSSYSADTRQAFVQIFKNASTGEKNLSQIYSESMLLARVKCADSWGNLRDIVTENADSLAIDLSQDSEYEKIKSSKRYEAFTSLFESRESFGDVEDIKEKFDSTVDDILEDQAKKPSSGGGGGGGGGGSSSDVGKPTGPSVNVSKDYEENIPVSDVAPYVPVEKFTDIKDHYSKEYVEKMIEKGIINGYEDGTFRPDNLVSRAEISKIISVALKLDNTDFSSDFSDVENQSWYAPYVCAMAKSGYIKGYNGMFMPSGNLKREDIAVIMANILSDEVEIEAVPFADSDEISDYAKESVSKINALGIMTGDDNEFRPADGITRAEVAIVVTRLLDILESK